MKQIKFIIIITIISCCNSKNNIDTYIPIEYIPIEKIDSLSLFQFYLETISSSYIGDITLVDNNLLFVDRIMCKVYTFDLDGNLLGEHLGKGEGPVEINTQYIDTYHITSNDKIFIGSNFDIYIYDKQWNRKDSYILNWQWKVHNIDLVVDPDPMEHALYTFDYENFFIKRSSHYLYAPIYSEHSTFNPFTSDKYYREGKILAKIDLRTKKVASLLGEKSPKYLNYKFVGHHSFFSFDINSRGDLFVSHEIDPIIYIYDSKGKLKENFGIAGKNMNTDYQEIRVTDIRNKQEVSQIRALYNEDRPKRGYYKNVMVFDEFELLFRSYTKGQNSNNDGLQIYQNKILIGDIEIPKNFRIIGYANPHFYATSFTNEVDQQIIIYRFNLEI